VRTIKTKIRYLIAFILVILIIISNLYILPQIGKKGIVIEYMDLEIELRAIMPDISFENSIEFESVSIIQLKNGTFMMPVIESEEFGKYKNICITTSKNLLNWTSPIKLTNYTFNNTMIRHFFGLKLAWLYDKMVIFYLYYPEDSINRENYWLYFESGDGVRWIGPKNCDEPGDPIWNELIRKEDWISDQIKNKDGNYLLVSSMDVSPSDIVRNHLFIQKSKNGREWTLPIRIYEYESYSPCIIQTILGDYVVIFSHHWNPLILRFNNSHINDLKEPYKVIANPMYEKSPLPYYLMSFSVTITLIAITIFIFEFKKK
jgi:hypothetical protein